MTNRQKLKKIQKIIDKYIDVLDTLPAGGEIRINRNRQINTIWIKGKSRLQNGNNNNIGW